MLAKQLFTFLENKSGHSTEVTEVLVKENIDLSVLCITENADLGILCEIISGPGETYKALKDSHFVANITDMVSISCPNVSGVLAEALGFLPAEEVFIEYTCSSVNNNVANVVIHPSSMGKCIEVLKERKVDLLAASNLYKS